MSVQATDGNEVAIGIRWLLDRLRTDTGPGGLRASGALLVGTSTASGIYEGMAPQGTSPPYVEIAYLSGGVVAATVGPEEVMASLRYQVKAIVAGADAGPAVPIVRRIFARLHNQGGSFSSGTSTGTVLSCLRDALISYIEGAPTATVRHHGHEYRLLVQSAT
jgi:hypothetical protein